MRFMHTLLRAAALPLALLVAVPAFAQSAITVTPDCGAEGDAFVVEGSGFTAGTTVSVAGTAAPVIFQRANRLVARVGQGTATGTTTVVVGSDSAPFVVLATGSPAVTTLSARNATVGQTVVAFGRRFGTAATVTVGGVPAVNVRSQHRVVVFEVPAGVASGAVDVVVTNHRGLSNAACPAQLTIVTSGPATITSIAPAAAMPGAPILITGTNLGAFGQTTVTWTPPAGTALRVHGRSNGYGAVASRVPFGASAGTTYTVAVASATITYQVGTAQAPSLDSLTPDQGPALTRFRITGDDLARFGASTTVTVGGVRAPILGFYVDRQTQKHHLLTAVPPTAASGAQPVAVRVGQLTSGTLDFTVGQTGLAVTSMRPDHPGPQGPVPIEIRGSGFSTFGGFTIAVTFEDQVGTVRRGFILHRNDNLIIVAPPGGRQNPLPTGVYTVSVVRNPPPGSRAPIVTVVAGTYTVP